MPTYEYLCGTCNNEWEAEQSIKEAPLTVCPRCSNPTAKRQISRGAGFILKGGGWYSDLYSGPSNAGAKGDGNKGDASGSSGSSGGSSPAGGSGSTPASGGSSTGGGAGGSSAAPSAT